MPARTAPPPKMNAMIRQNRLVAYQASRRLPEPAQTTSGMMEMNPTTAANNLRKVIIPT